MILLRVGCVFGSVAHTYTHRCLDGFRIGTVASLHRRKGWWTLGRESHFIFSRQTVCFYARYGIAVAEAQLRVKLREGKERMILQAIDGPMIPQPVQSFKSSYKGTIVLASYIAYSWCIRSLSCREAINQTGQDNQGPNQSRHLRASLLA